jgi:hypothetical protein
MSQKRVPESANYPNWLVSKQPLFRIRKTYGNEAL